MVKITTPVQFINEMASLVTAAETSAAKRMELDKKISALQETRKDLAPTASPEMLENMDYLLAIAKEGRAVTVETGKAGESGSGTDFLIKRIIMPTLTIPLGIYLYQVRDKLPNLDGFTTQVKKTVLPALVAKLNKLRLPEPIARNFKPGIGYLQEAGKITWQGYDSWLLLLAGVGTLGLILAFVRDDSKKENELVL